jgi:hypothetical protein
VLAEGNAESKSAHIGYLDDRHHVKEHHHAVNLGYLYEPGEHERNVEKTQHRRTERGERLLRFPEKRPDPHGEKRRGKDAPGDFLRKTGVEDADEPAQSGQNAGPRHDLVFLRGHLRKLEMHKPDEHDHRGQHGAERQIQHEAYHQRGGR